ncbi:hypothetical protein BOX15_Mlig020704g1 [Macrostomum lignano]|uniref:Amiloride-sensitive sodium channel n=1 Tax=Macrostomum lignano TaxID=282301 RepID=A0A267GRS7_9PLAT|nr:hypothetical protein BOX15_Mlig020704g1 [Macrostomum lignano]
MEMNQQQNQQQQQPQKEDEKEPLNSDPEAGTATAGSTKKACRQPRKRIAQVKAAFQENSIPALRKMARSADVCHRLFWAVVFLATFTGFVIHLVSITIRYQSTPVSTETRVERVDRMPSILLCPQNYLSGTRIRSMLNVPNPRLRNVTFEMIYNEILPMFWNFIYKIRDNNVDRKMVGMKIKNNFLWYLIHMWRERGQIQHEKEDVFVHIGLQDDDEPAMKDLGTTFDSQRNRCFSWEPQEHVTSPLTAVINVPDGWYFYAEQDAFELVSDSGLWLYICFNESFGCHDSIRYFLRTGHYTKIDLRKMVVSQLPVVADNKTSCIAENKFYQIKEDLFVSSSRTLNVAYTSALCTDVTLQRQIYEQCGCLSALLPTEIDLYNSALSSLGDTRNLFCNLPPDDAFTHQQFPRECREDPRNDTLCMVRGLDGVSTMPFSQLLKHDDIAQFLKRDECHDHEFRSRVSVDKCPKVCRRQQFSSVHSIVPWPESQLSRKHPSTFARIFVNTIKPFLDKAIVQLNSTSVGARVLETMRAAFLKGMNYSNPQPKPLYEAGLEYMQERLLLLEIGYASADMQVMSESEAYPLKSFLSDIGGIMGLWIGMAIVSICEFLLIFGRLVYFVGHQCARRGPKT